MHGDAKRLKDVLHTGEMSGSHGGENEDDLFSGMLRRVVWYKFNHVSIFSPEDGDSTVLRNVGIYLQVYTASQPRTTSPS
jgi:hypothetical protein